MTIKTEGALKFSEIQAEFGGSNPISLSEYYRGVNVPTGTSYSNFTAPVSGGYVTGIPSSGAINMKAFYGRGEHVTWTESQSPVKSTTNLTYENQKSFSLSTYLPDLEDGDTFAVCIMHMAGTGWTHYNTRQLTLACTKGTFSALTATEYYDKQWFLSATYNGDDTVTIGGYYARKSTNYSQGGAYLQALVRT